MARENRRENRKAAKEILEGDELNAPTREDIKAAQEAQMDFLDEISEEDMFSTDEDEDELVEVVTKNGEVEGVIKAPAPSADSGNEDNLTSSEGEEEESFELGDEEGKVAPAKEPASIEKKETPLVEKPAAEVKKEPVAEVKVEEKKPETKVTPETPEVLSEDEAAKLYTNWRDQTEVLLAEHHYRLDEQQVEQLNENPAAFIPKLMSKVYMDCLSASFQQFTNYLPRMVGQVLEARESTTKNENAFFSAWPDLVDNRDLVLRLGQAYRRSNPSATTENFINEVGAQAMVALRKPISNGTAAAAEKPKKTPFRPAVNTPSAAPVPSTSNNPFENLASEFGMSEEDMDDN